MSHASIPIDSPREPLVGPRIFADRRAAGRLLVRALIHHAGTNAIVLGLPRGGMPVADEVARGLGAALDLWVVRKLGAPLEPERAMGAIAEGPAVVLDRAAVRTLGGASPQLLGMARRELAEVRRSVERFRGGRAAPELRGRTVILVDDGIATGNTMRAVIRAVRKRGPGRLVVAAPVAPADVVAGLRGEVDEVVCLHQPDSLRAIGLWYEEFRPVSGEEVARILERAERDASAAS
jgi:putative phosphoribosyl transferase